MFIYKKRYEALISTIIELKHEIKIRDQYIECLKRDINLLKIRNNFNIDFPNSTKGGFEDSNIFTL